MQTRCTTLAKVILSWNKTTSFPPRHHCSVVCSPSAWSLIDITDVWGSAFFFFNTILNVCISRGNWSLRDVSNLHRLNKTRAQNLSGIPEQGQSDSCNLTRKTRHPHKWRLNCLIPAVCRATRWSWLWRTSLTLPIHNPWSGPLWANMTSATTNCQLSAQSKKIKMMQCLTSNAHKEQLG